MDYPFHNPKLSLSERLTDLLSRLTLKEKLSLLSTAQPAIERLNIKAYSIGGEAAHGVVDRSGGKTTVFPQPIGLSCTWNPALMHKIGAAIGEEARGFYDKKNQQTGLTLWAPTIDMERDPRWGRTEEAYGEDPHLTGRLSAALIKGMQGNDPFYVRMVAAPKHFYGNNNEHGREYISNSIDPRNRYEYYLKAFQPAFVEANALSMMTAYNGVNGVPAMQINELQEVVRDQWGMEGFIVSDGGALSLNVEAYRYYFTYAEALADALKKGIDCFVDDKDKVIAAATQAFEQKLITETDVTRAIRNILSVRFRLGQFDAATIQNPYATITKDVLASDKFVPLVRKATEESIVLLKNQANMLPLEEAKTNKIAVIGPTANQVFRDWYTGYPPYAISPFAGLNQHSNQASVTFTSGHDTIALKHKQTGRYLAISNQQTLRTDRMSINQAAQWVQEDWGWNWNLLKSVSNRRYVTLTKDEPALVASKDEVFDWFVREKIGFYQNQQNPTQYHLTSWQEEPLQRATDDRIVPGKQADMFEKIVLKSGIEQAVEQARNSDVAIVCVGNHPMINGKETEDRPSLELPHHQQKLIQEVYRANKRTIVVVIGSYPFTLNWEQANIPAILYSSHGSQELGNALRAVLFGETSPSGKLSMTWYKSTEDLPSIFDYDIIKGKRTYMYAENNILYPFGYGLHYGKVTYHKAEITANTEEQIKLAVTLTNTSKRKIQEVVQVYAAFENGSVKRPNRLLVAFQKVALEPGVTKLVSLKVAKFDLTYYDVATESYRFDIGQCHFYVGTSSHASTLKTESIILANKQQITRSLADKTKAENYDDYYHVVIGKGEKNQNAVINKKDGWICFHNVSFQQMKTLSYRVTTDGASGAVLCYLDDISLPPVSHQTITVDHPNQWKDYQVEIPVTKDTHDLYIAFNGPVYLTTMQLIEDR